MFARCAEIDDDDDVADEQRYETHVAERVEIRDLGFGGVNYEGIVPSW